MSDIKKFRQITPADGPDVGGKGLSLGLLAGAGLPVPPGFCVTTAAHRRLGRQPPSADADLVASIDGAYQELGGGLVAVRSSATAEDGAAVSFAGQQETVLGVQGLPAVLEAVGRCWESLHGERAVAYRRQQRVADHSLAMAVVVQRLVPAEIAGVLFTRDPLDPSGRQMLIEAAWGLGEALVSGQVMPDRFHIDRLTGTVRERSIAAKEFMRTLAGMEPVPAEQQQVPCLNDSQLAELAALGRQVEGYHGEARDVEWAFADGRFWLLQARPITTGGVAEREQVRQEEIAALRAAARPGGTVWARFNLAEVLPEPTPMTWAIVRGFMSGRGGFGLMYRDLGFEPDPQLDEACAYDLVCGRPYCNLSREPGFQFRLPPLKYNFAALKADPARAVYPRPGLLMPDTSQISWRFWVGLPVLIPKMIWDAVRLQRRLTALSQTFADDFRKRILPAYLDEVRRAETQDLGPLTDAVLLEQLAYWRRRTLVDFARESLKPTPLAALAHAALEKTLLRQLGPERGREVLGQKMMGARPDPDADYAGAVVAVAAGQRSRDEFLRDFGHRGSNEMELAQPRWREDPAGLNRLLANGGPPPTGMGPARGPLHLSEADTSLTPEEKTLHLYIGLRETAKHHLMRGYALLRRLLVELDRRHRLDGGVFFLEPEELPRLVAGENLGGLIAQRRRRRALARSLEAPQVLFSDDLEAIGRSVPITDGDVLQGVPLSAGVAKGPALVLERPGEEPPAAEPYILVCPSTDPSWVPLFVGACGLVMETGGVLSHGAIVAREFGLPAVAGLAGVQRRLKTGQRLRVDGGSGQVVVLP